MNEKMFKAAEKFEGMSAAEIGDYFNTVSDCCGMAVRFAWQGEEKTDDLKCVKCGKICQGQTQAEYDKAQAEDVCSMCGDSEGIGRRYEDGMAYCDLCDAGVEVVKLSTWRKVNGR